MSEHPWRSDGRFVRQFDRVEECKWGHHLPGGPFPVWFVFYRTESTAGARRAWQCIPSTDWDAFERRSQIVPDPPGARRPNR